MNPETILQSHILKSVGSLPHVRMFRNQCGVGWVGKVTPGPAVRRVTMGLCPGSSDLIGWTTRVITPDMVGTRVAVFTAIEVKTATGATTPEQRLFLDRVVSDGGIGIVARSQEQAVKAVS